MSDEWQSYLKDTRRICKYGVNCYQKNPNHQNKFKHPPKQFKGKADNNKRNSPRYNPYSRNEKTKKVDDTKNEQDKTEKNLDITVKKQDDTDKNQVETDEKQDDTDKKQVETDKKPDETEKNVHETEKKVGACSTSEKNNSKREKAVSDRDCIADNIFSKLTIDDSTQYFDKDCDNKMFKDCFLVEMPSDFFKFYECLKSEEVSVEKLLSTVNLQLIGPYDLLLGKLPIIDDKDLYLIHWRFYYDPPEFQAVLKKKGKSEYHIGYFRDSPTEAPVFLAENNSQKDCAIKPIAKNIFGAVYWYLQNEKKTSPFASVACQKFMEKISKWAKECDYSLEEFHMKNRHAQTVCKSFHGAGIVVPYNKQTQLGYRPLAESDAKIRKLFKQLADAASQQEKDSILSELQPVITYANIAVDECDFGTGLEAGIAMFCSGQKLLEPTASSHLCAVYRLLDRDAFSKIIQVHMKYRRKGPDMSITSG